RHRYGGSILDELHAGALDAVDDTVLLLGDRAADETFRVAPEVAIEDPRFCAELGLHHFEVLFARQARHFLVLDLDRAHRAGRAGLLAAGLLPTLVDEMRVEGPGLRQLQLLVPPDVAIRTGIDELLLTLGLRRIDNDDAILALCDDAGIVGLHARRIVAMVAHGGDVGDVDHRYLPAFLLQNVDPLMTVLRHRRRVTGPVIADIFVHGCEGAQIAV